MPGVITLYHEKTLCMAASPVPVTEMPPLCVLTLSVSEPRIGSASGSFRAWTLTADNLGLPALTTLRGNFLWQRNKFASVGSLAVLADLLGTHYRSLLEQGHHREVQPDSGLSQGAPDVLIAHVWKVLESWALLGVACPAEPGSLVRVEGRNQGKEANTVGFGLVGGKSEKSADPGPGHAPTMA